MKKRTVTIGSSLALAALVTWSASVWAATPTYFTDRLSFEATMATLITDDYAPPVYPAGFGVYSNAAMTAFLGETSYTSTGFPDLNIIDSDQTYCSGCNGSFLLDFAGTSLTVGAGVAGVGLDILGNSPSDPYFAFVTFGDGTTDDIALPTTTPAFFAVIAPQQVVSIHFGLSGGGATTAGAFRIDNLTIGDELVGVLDIDPTSIDFGDEVVGDITAASMVTLSNIGFASLDVTGLEAATAPFARSGGSCAAGVPITIAAGDSCTLEYTFSPTETGLAQQSIGVTANVDGGGSIQLSGNGVQGNLVIDPLAIDFGDVLVDGSSAGVSVTLTNDGTASLDVTALTDAAAPFARSGGTCAAAPPITLAASDSCTLEYSFSPTASGFSDQTLTVTANAPGSGSILLEGTGVQGNLVIDPTSIDFGDEGVGSVSAVQTVTLSNDGDASLDVTDLTAAAAPFALSGGTCGAALPISIAGGASCTLEFTFSPSAVGAASQALTVTADAPGSGSIQLDGNGVQGNLVIAPAALDLGDTIVGQISAVGTITLSNDGDVSLEVSSLTLAGLPFVRTDDGSCGNSLPFSIASGGSCTLAYVFAPTADGPAQQNFTVGSDASGDTSFEMFGVGLPADEEIFFDGFEPNP